MRTGIDQTLIAEYKKEEEELVVRCLQVRPFVRPSSFRRWRENKKLITDGHTGRFTIEANERTNRSIRQSKPRPLEHPNVGNDDVKENTQGNGTKCNEPMSYVDQCLKCL